MDKGCGDSSLKIYTNDQYAHEKTPNTVSGQGNASKP